MLEEHAILYGMKSKMSSAGSLVRAYKITEEIVLRNAQSSMTLKIENRPTILMLNTVCMSHEMIEEMTARAFGTE
jgi:hypothetical protein